MADWFVIFTRSDPPCIWCKRAKELLQVYGCDYYEKDISVDEAYRREFKEAGFKTIPQVYFESEYIGGHDALKEYLRGQTKGAKDEKLSERLTRI